MAERPIGVPAAKDQPWVFVGDVTCGSTFGASGLATFRAGATVAAGSLNVTATNVLLAGSQFGITLNMAAGNALSGGQLVQASGGVALAAAALSPYVTGVAVPNSPVASGGTVPVLVFGAYALTAADTVNAGSMVIAGSAAHTIQVGTNNNTVVAFGKAITGAASGATAIVLVGGI